MERLCRYVLHVSSIAQSSATSNLQPVLDRLCPSPHRLFTAYYRQTAVVAEADNLPPNIAVCSLPWEELSYEHCVSEAESLFLRLFPDKAFMPKAQDFADSDSDEA